MYSRESNAHYYAKEIFKNWLEQTTQYNMKHGYKNVLSHLEWDGNVYLEYPIYSKKLQDGNKDILGLQCQWTQYPTEKHVIAGKLHMEASIDIVVCDKGKPKYGIEIVHKHLCSEAKREFLTSLKEQGINFQVYEVSAAWVLEQMHGHVPKILDMVRV
jgi:hypothetical protein